MKEMKHDETQRDYALIRSLGIVMLVLLMLMSIAGAAPFAYITNNYASNISVIDTATNTVTTSIELDSLPFGVTVNPEGTRVYVSVMEDKIIVIDTDTNSVITSVNVGSYPAGVAVTPSGTKVYATNYGGIGTVSVIDTATNTVTATIPVGNGPNGIAVAPNGLKVYVTCIYDYTTSVIDTTTNTVTAIIPAGNEGIAVSPDGTKIYVANGGSNNVSVIDAATNTVITAVNVGSGPLGIALTPDGTNIYVANCFSSNVSVIDAITNTITATVDVGEGPSAFGQFICPVLTPEPQVPVANFSASPTIGKAPLTVTFADKSTGSPTCWHWKFGDKCVSTDQNPVHTYGKAGKYTVSLTVENEAGKDTKKICKYIIVKNK